MRYSRGLVRLDDLNNNATATVELGVSSPTLDLAVTSLAAPATADPGDVLTLAATVASLGNGVLAGVVDFSVDGTVVGRAPFYDLAAGASTVVRVRWDTTGWAGGTHVIGASVPGLPGEAGLANNRVERPIVLSGAVEPPTSGGDDAKKRACAASVPTGGVPLVLLVLVLAGCLVRRRA